MSKIIVEPKTARLYRDTDTFGKMDPYVTVQCGTEKKKTKTHSSGGKNPSWTDALSLKVKDDTMTITVWDEDIGKDDFVGSTALDLNKISSSGGLKDWITIYHKGKEAGQVYLEITLADKKADYGYSYGAPGYAPTAPTTYYAPPAPAPAPAPMYYPSTSYAPAPAPAPAYPAAYPSAYPSAYPATAYPATAYPSYTPAPAPAPAPAYPAYPSYTPAPAPAPAPTYPSTYPGAPGATYTPPGGSYGGYGGGYQ
jgi:hypothetical protein